MSDTRLQYLVHFICGAFVGACSGFFLYSYLAPLAYAWLAIPVVALLGGIASAHWGDAFWERGIHWLLWW